MAEKFSADCHSCLYMEASAKGNINVADCFTSVVRRGEPPRRFGVRVGGREWEREWERGSIGGAVCYGVLKRGI